MTKETLIDYIYSINVILVIYFIVINILDYLTTIVFFKQGHTELNLFIDYYLKNDKLMQLFILKVVAVSILLISIILIQKKLESIYFDNKLIRTSFFSISITLLCTSIIMTLVVINNIMIINNMEGLICV